MGRIKEDIVREASRQETGKNLSLEENDQDSIEGRCFYTHGKSRSESLDRSKIYV